MPEWWYEDAFDGIRQGFRVDRVHVEDTEYQRLEVFHHPRLGHILVLDGIVQTTEGDEWVYHEVLAHVPILGTARAPETVLIIGGGDGGTLRQVLRHESVLRVTLVELDEAVVALSKRFLSFSDSFDDPRVDLVFGDGAAWVRSAARGSDSFDAILIDTTDPEGPARVLFEAVFYGAVRECLSPHGVAAQQAGIPAYGPEVLQQASRGIGQAFGSVQVFRAPIPTYIGGDMAFVSATRDSSPLQMPRADFRGRFYNPSVHTASFALPTWWRDLLSQTT